MDEKLLETVSKARRSLRSAYWLTPTNLNEERERFFSDSNYNPQFIYPKAPEDELTKLLDKLESAIVKKPAGDKEVIDAKRIDETILKIRLILSRGDPDITIISEALYRCTYSDDYIDQAKKDAKLRTKFRTREDIGPEDVAEKIKEYLAGYGVTDWKIVISAKRDFNFRIIPRKRLIFISRYVNWDYCNIDCTLAHEVDAHMVRAINSRRQEKAYLRRPLPFYLKTEEGLASFLSDYTSETDKISRKHHALKYLAGYVALHNPFREVYSYLLDNGFTEDLAFQRTLRLKRGFKDTENPGVFAREAIYYEGMIDVKNYIDNGGDIKKLFAAKAGLDDLDKVEIPEGTIIPKRIERYNR